MKVCSICKVAKPRKEFYKCRSAKDKLQERCKLCWGLFPSQAKELCSERARRHELKQFNLTPESYDRILREQGYKCKICCKDSAAERRNLAVDHDHATGRVRGLLCDNCNKALGCFKDNVTIIKAAIKYLS